MTPIKIDFTRTAGSIKPLHGINNSPLTYGNPLDELKSAGIPYTRMHDTAGAFGGTYFVDIPNVFPNFDADPADPASYEFAFTDAYFKGLTASGIKIFYRLGVTIENNYKIKAYRIHPPKDFEKWARICEGIIRHYNEGWANGFKYGIEYWEIWNEPENPPMWTGTREQFYDLYRVAANHLKKRFPQLKIGGYGGCGFYAINRAGADDFSRSFVAYFTDFLKYITNPATSAPLDFFSWHLYTTDLAEIVLHAEYVDETLRKHGLSHVENIFNEWNYMDWSDPGIYDDMKEMPGATFVAAAFCLMQKSPIDKAMYYDALPSRRFCGLYYFPSQKVTRTYHSFRAFNELYKLGTAVECSSDEAAGIYVCAAKGGNGAAAALVVNLKDVGQDAPLLVEGFAGRPKARMLDRTRTLKSARCFTDSGLALPPRSVVLLQFAKKSATAQAGNPG